MWCGVQLRNCRTWGRHFCSLICETFLLFRLGDVCLRGLSILGVRFFLGGLVAVWCGFLSIWVFLLFLLVIIDAGVMSANGWQYAVHSCHHRWWQEEWGRW
jgi:hypothetical protein